MYTTKDIKKQIVQQQFYRQKKKREKMLQKLQGELTIQKIGNYNYLPITINRYKPTFSRTLKIPINVIVFIQIYNCEVALRGKQLNMQDNFND